MLTPLLRPTLIALALLLTSLSQAQNWVYPGSEWHYDCYTPSVAATGYVKINYTGDVLISNRNCQVLHRESSTYSYLYNMYGTINLSDLYTFDSANVVYIYNGVGFDTLYNFNAVPGDRWEMTGNAPNANCDPNSHVVVLDTGTMVINTLPLHYLHVQLDYGPLFPGPYYDTIVERIGSIVNYILPYDLAAGLYDEGGFFRCYSDSNFATYKPHYSNACNYIINTTSIEETLTLHIQAFPNPAHDLVYLQGIPTNANAQYRIYTTDGRLMQTGELVNESIAIAALQAGYYVLEIQTENQLGHTALLKY